MYIITFEFNYKKFQKIILKERKRERERGASRGEVIFFIASRVNLLHSIPLGFFNLSVTPFFVMISLIT